MQPVIGLTCNYDLSANRTVSNFTYENAIEAAGGVSFLLPSTAAGHIDALIDRMDGLLLTGGVDVDPFRYGCPSIPALGEVCPIRDELEIAFCRAALAAGKPVLGICRGIQLLNIACGGTLIQDLPSQKPGCWKHAQQCPHAYQTHPVELVPDSKLAGIVGHTSIYTNSHHHQAVDKVAPGFAVCATTADGVIEAIEAEQGWALGVQWHPEGYFPKDPDAAAIFRAFIDACAANQAKG